MCASWRMHAYLVICVDALGVEQYEVVLAAIRRCAALRLAPHPQPLSARAVCGAHLEPSPTQDVTVDAL